MAANNLRIVTNNVVTAVGGSFTGTAANILNEYKSSYATTAAATFTLSAIVASGRPTAVILVVSSTATSLTMTVTGTGVPASSTITETTPTVSTNIGYGGVRYLAVYFTTTATTGTLTIAIPSGTTILRAIVGEYVTPTYNTSFGVSIGYTDNSEISRTHAGDLYTIDAPRNKTLTFDLNYISEVEKLTFFNILRSVGKKGLLFVSVFPTDTDKAKEQIFSIYGKQSDLSNIVNTMFTVYSTNMSIEEF